MDIPHRGPRLPQILIHDSNPRGRFDVLDRPASLYTTSATATSSIPMPIPRATALPPPPLPPPRHLADMADGGANGPDLAWQWGNRTADWQHMDEHTAPSPTHRRTPSFPRRPDQKISPRSIRNTTVMSGFRPASHERQSSLTGSSVASNRSPIDEGSARAGFFSSVHDTFRTNASAYDQSLLQRLNTRSDSEGRTPPRTLSQGPAGTPTSEAHASFPSEQRHPVLKPLSLPVFNSTRPHLVESPMSRWGETPISSAISPRNPFPRFAHGPAETRSARDGRESERSPIPCVRRSGSNSTVGMADDSLSMTSRSRESYDSRISPEHDADFHMEEAGMRRLQLEDYHGIRADHAGAATAGQKRRASSPPRDDLYPSQTVGSASDLQRRRESAARSSPSPRFQNCGSFSSTASGIRNNSYASTHSSYAPSSITSYDGRSPGGLSPATPDTTVDSPHALSISLNSSPRGSASQAMGHHRALSDTRPVVAVRKAHDPTSHPKKAIPRVQGMYICECCPKKPKKFDTLEELSNHEQEKQYVCTYCRNRFKNKNEAERHQNSLHLRRHSWSCAALAGYAAAFHPSSSSPHTSDTCGYCGEDFARNGLSTSSTLGQQEAVPSDRDWELRINHLQEAHKFGECNHAKKFFRADHFRQHLKHSHAGTSGKWTNMLENACMKDEPLPEPMRAPERISLGSLGMGRVDMISEEEEAAAT